MSTDDLHLEFGWVNDPEAVERTLEQMPRPIFSDHAAAIAGSGEGKVVLLHKAVEQVVGSFPINHQTVGDCFVAGSIVLGERVQTIEQVQIGDRVWTGEGRLTRVISKRSIETVRPLVRIRPIGGLPITCTADHRFLVYRMARVHGKRVNLQYYRRMQARRGQAVACAVMDCYEKRQPEWVAAGDLRDTDCLLTPISVERPSMPVQSPGDLLTSDDGRFAMGYFLGNGHASGGTVELDCPTLEKAKTIAAGFARHGFSPRARPYRDGRRAVRVRVHCSELVRWCREQFYRDGEKQFPAWAIGDAAFFDGLRSADGHETSTTIDSTSPSIIYGAALTLIDMGFEPVINQCSRSPGTYKNAKPLYRVIWRVDKQRYHVWRDETFVCRPVRSVEFIEGPTTVYDIGVEDPHHSFLVHGAAVHNCVSHGLAGAAQVLMCVEIMAGEPEEWRGLVATEPIYAGSRVEVGGGRLGNSDGSIGAWAAKWVTDWGIIPRGKYGSIDLTTYSGDRARDWGRRGAGCPDELEPIAKQHPIKTASKTTSYEQARDAIANGYPVSVASNRGFNTVRDSEGFLKPSGSWAHQMYFCSLDDEHRRPGLLCVNSWGTNWVRGPLRHGQPEGSFWVDADVADSMLRQGDSFAYSGFEGFPSQKLDYLLI